MSQDVLEQVFSKEKQAETELQELQASLNAKLLETKKKLEEDLKEELEKAKTTYENKLNKELEKLSQQLKTQEITFNEEVAKYKLSKSELTKITKKCFLSLKDGNRKTL